MAHISRRFLKDWKPSPGKRHLHPENQTYTRKTNIIRQAFLSLSVFADSKISRAQISPARKERPAEKVAKAIKKLLFNFESFCLEA